MRILLVNYEYPPVGAGAGTATQAIAKELVQSGHEAVVLTGRFAGLPNSSQEDGVVIQRVASFRKAKDRCTIPEMISFVASALVSLPGIVRRHRIEGALIFFSFPCGPIGLVARWRCGVPYVISLRGGDVPGNEPHLNSLHKLLAPIRHTVLRNSVAIVANSDGLRKLAEAADPFPVRTIPNGVDTAFFKPAPADHETKGGRRFRILFAGRLQAQKNLPLLFQQLAQLPSASYELHLVGDGPLNAHLRALANDLGIAAAITWHGWLSRSALREVYRSADCLVNPSLYEGMPNVVLEAMACGKPIIASRVAGNDAVVQEGVTGFLFSLNKPATLRELLQTLLSDPIRAAEMGRKGREWTERNFSWSRVAAAYVQLFETR
jgi:glycosyltransferase involved in cell wall biosynthesis